LNSFFHFLNVFLILLGWLNKSDQRTSVPCVCEREKERKVNKSRCLFRDVGLMASSAIQPR
jgi:hypothetical protein